MIAALIFAAVVLYGIVLVAVVAGMAWVVRKEPYVADTEHRERPFLREPW